MPENSATESQETVSLAINETQETLTQATPETENNANSQTPASETSSEAMSDTESMAASIIRLPEISYPAPTAAANSQTSEKHSQPINAIAISPDGKMLASSSKDGTINLWDIGSGKLLRSIRGYGEIVFSPDGQQFVTVAQDNTIQLWQIYGSAIEQ